MSDSQSWFEDFGSPGKNGHKVISAVNPDTQQECEAVFIPKRAKGEWDCAIQFNDKVHKDEMVDNDLDALRTGQLSES